jgi:hypothetical protein
LQFQKNSYVSFLSVAKLKNIGVFAFTSVAESLGLFYGDFGMNSFRADSNEAMKQGVRAFKSFISSIDQKH